MMTNAEKLQHEIKRISEIKTAWKNNENRTNFIEMKKKKKQSETVKSFAKKLNKHKNNAKWEK